MSYTNAPCREYLPTFSREFGHFSPNVGKYSLHGASGIGFPDHLLRDLSFESLFNIRWFPGWKILVKLASDLTDLTPKCSSKKGNHLISGNLGWGTIIIWPEDCQTWKLLSLWFQCDGKLLSKVERK